MCVLQVFSRRSRLLPCGLIWHTRRDTILIFAGTVHTGRFVLHTSSTHDDSSRIGHGSNQAEIKGKGLDDHCCFSDKHHHSASPRKQHEDCPDDQT